MRLALSGHGAMATEHLGVLRELGVEPRVVLGADAVAVERYAREHGFERATTDERAALTADDVDVVVIASPSECHAAQARLAIDAAKHVLIEIPIALSGADARDLAARAAASERTVMAGHISRYYPVIQGLRTRIEAGALTVHHAIAAIWTDKRRNRNWLGEPRDWIDDLLWHHGLHVIDTVLWLLSGDPVASSSVQAGRQHPEHGGEMDLGIVLRTSSGTLATIALSYHADTQRTRYALIAEEATLNYEQGSPADSPPHELLAGGTFRGLVMSQDRAFLEACASGSRAPIPLAAVLESMAVLDDLQAQVDRQRRPRQ
jgi:2-hydroxy-4-carboxymuconate semialdehyde hemiacetal dehydrogenase